MNRSDKFKEWLKDLTPEKVTLLENLERAARLVSHVKHLTNTIDEKLVTGLIQRSEELRASYSDEKLIYIKLEGRYEDAAKQHHIRPA